MPKIIDKETEAVVKKLSKLGWSCRSIQKSLKVDGITISYKSVSNIINFKWKQRNRSSLGLGKIAFSRIRPHNTDPSPNQQNSSRMQQE